jgi:hypothetical protein
MIFYLQIVVFSLVDKVDNLDDVVVNEVVFVNWAWIEFKKKIS